MQKVSGVQHAGQILTLFTSGEPEWGAAEAGRALGLSRSHTHRLLSTLSEIGLLDRLEPSGRFRLSWSWFAYTSALMASDRLVTSGTPIMRKLYRISGIRPVLAVWRDGTILSLQPAPDLVVTRLEFEECVPVALVLMAGLPENELEAAVSSGRGIRGFPGRDEVDDCLRRVRSGDLLVKSDRADGDGRWVVAPVADERQVIVAALAVHVPAHNGSTGQMVATLMKKASTMITAALSRSAP